MLNHGKDKEALSSAQIKKACLAIGIMALNTLWEEYFSRQ